eukprot:363857-Chlamydomonas_euryale.AAC.1
MGMHHMVNPVDAQVLLTVRWRGIVPIRETADGGCIVSYGVTWHALDACKCNCLQSPGDSLFPMTSAVDVAEMEQRLGQFGMPCLDGCVMATARHGGDAHLTDDKKAMLRRLQNVSGGHENAWKASPLNQIPKVSFEFTELALDISVLQYLSLTFNCTRNLQHQTLARATFPSFNGIVRMQSILLSLPFSLCQ